MSVALSRLLSETDGRFAGVVVAEIALSQLRALLKSLNLDQAGSVTLFRDDGILFTRYHGPPPLR